MYKFPDKYKGEKTHGYFYGSYERDQEMFNNRVNYSRFGSLTRRLLSHYLDDIYNPLTVELYIEIAVRHVVAGLVEFKVLNHAKGYDWNYIDHSMRKLLGVLFDVQLSYDNAIVEAGISQEYRGLDNKLVDQFTAH